MHKIDLTERRDFTQRIKYPILYRTPWHGFSSPRSMPWHSGFVTVCERCGLKLDEELPWRKGHGELCHDCDMCLKISVPDRLKPTGIAVSATYPDCYDSVFIAEYGT